MQIEIKKIPKVTSENYHLIKQYLIHKGFKHTGYNQYYINNKGCVLNLSVHANSKLIVKSSYDKDRYKRVTLTNLSEKSKFISVHRLVAKEFVFGYKENLVVNHKDGNRENNNFENLEWITAKENEQHARKVLGKRCLGEKASRSKLKTEDVLFIRSCDLTTKEIQEKFCISNAQIVRIKKRINWSHI